MLESDKCYNEKPHEEEYEFQGISVCDTVIRFGFIQKLFLDSPLCITASFQTTVCLYSRSRSEPAGNWEQRQERPTEKTYWPDDPLRNGWVALGDSSQMAGKDAEWLRLHWVI